MDTLEKSPSQMGLKEQVIHEFLKNKPAHRRKMLEYGLRYLPVHMAKAGYPYQEIQETLKELGFPKELREIPLELFSG